ncbi:IS110 family transposase [Nocardia sp. NPDC019255]|uniref:IS110 family transposase n=1 Tax=Nocardia sp. NPDC019255 TaxID=3154591 RepID=UPI0033E5ADC6
MTAVRLWAGVDVGKKAHHCVVIDDDGGRLFSSRVANDEASLVKLLDAVQGLRPGVDITWATDLNRGPASLLLALLFNRHQKVIYLHGRVFHHAAAVYPGSRKTDARDAAIIADHARMRRDLRPMKPLDEVALELRLLTARRATVSADRVRAINRLRVRLLEYFPALETAFDFKQSKAGLLILSEYQTPQKLREMGACRLTEWLQDNNIRIAAKAASAAIAAAESQRTVIPGEQLLATLVERQAKDILSLNADLAEIDASVAVRFHRHKHAELILSMPGFGVKLGADFIAGTGGDMLAYGSADRLAAACGLAPIPRDSGSITGSNRRPTHYDRRLLRACYMSAQIAIRSDDASRVYYERKRAEGKIHVQAVLALARRRVNVLWAILRDRTPYRPRAPRD